MADAIINQAIKHYQNKEMAKRDIQNLIRHYADLRPKQDTFVFNNGQPKQLLCLDGTIPVNYKGAVYNIPINLWLLDTHPYNPPMVFVKPTANMQIKPGKHVDVMGRVYLPYLTEWKYPNSDLYGLVQIVTIIFSEECPVFSRTPSQPHQYTAQNRTPYPAQGSYGMPMPGGGHQAPSYPGGYNQPPAQSYGGYPTPTSTYNPQPQQGYGAGSYPPQTGYPPQMSAAPTGGRTAQVSSQQSLNDEQIKMSLLSAVEDKMRRRLREVCGQTQAEMEALKKTQEDLNRNKTKLNEMMQKLEREQNELDRNITVLQDKDQELKDALGKMDNSETIDIDEAVVTTAPLYKQLLHAFSEEQAIEDTIYYLCEALRKEVIDLDTFLKQVRELSRRQCMLRALITKCRQRAGLPEVMST